jgi:hypothetical protein
VFSPIFNPAQVGYGDVYPFTALGRAVAAFLAVCAVILLSLSAALLSVNLAETKRTTQQLDQTEKETWRIFKNCLSIKRC